MTPYIDELAEQAGAQELGFDGDALLEAEGGEGGVECAGFDGVDGDALLGEHGCHACGEGLAGICNCYRHSSRGAAVSSAIRASAAARRSSSADSTVAEMRPIVASAFCWRSLRRSIACSSRLAAAESRATVVSSAVASLISIIS